MRKGDHELRRYDDGSIDYDFYRARAARLRSAARTEFIRGAWHFLCQTALKAAATNRMPAGATLIGRTVQWAVVLAGCLGIGFGFAADQDKEALIKDALSAAPPMMAGNATVMDWDGTVLRQGTGAYVCHPTPPDLRGKGREPMCLDQTWMTWAHAWMHKQPFKADQVGIGYMLAGDAGASNIDPYADAPTSDNQWVLEGPHVMIILPDAALLEGLPTDPNSGGAYVMWKGTPYAHIMVPVGERPAQKR